MYVDELQCIQHILASVFDSIGMESKGTASTADQQAIDQSICHTSALRAQLTRQQISQTISSLASQSLTRWASVSHSPSLLFAMFHWNKPFEMWASLSFAHSHKKKHCSCGFRSNYVCWYIHVWVWKYVCFMYLYKYIYEDMCWYDDVKAKATTTEQVHSLTASRSWQFSSFILKIFNFWAFVLAFCFCLLLHYLFSTICLRQYLKKLRLMNPTKPQINGEYFAVELSYQNKFNAYVGSHANMCIFTAII